MMSPAEVTKRVTEALGWRLGRFRDRTTGADEGPAVYVGRVPAQWEAVGLEVNVEAPVLDNRPVHAGVVLAGGFVLRVVAHDGVSMTAVQNAAARLSQAFETTNPTLIPADEELGILQQFTLQVRS